MEKEPIKTNYYQAEFLVKKDMPVFEFDEDGFSFVMQLKGLKQECNRQNTRLYAFAPPYGAMDNIRVTRGKKLPFFIFLREIDENIATQLVEIIDEKEFPLSYEPIPDAITAEVFYKFMRGDEPIEDIVNQILE